MFSEELKALRIRLGLTQLAMADRLHVDRSTYCRWEHTARPPAYAIERISKEFGVDASIWLRTEEGASSEAGPQIVHMRSQEEREDAEEHQWRMKAVDLLGRMTDLLENLLKGKGKRGGGVTDPGTLENRSRPYGAGFVLVWCM